ncbi:MAG: hypothetical protein R2822_15155 [Spirosomataceae bacterium]
MPLSLTVDPVPAPPATNGFGYSTAQLHDPTGTIVITAPTGPTIQYSVGGPYQSLPLSRG